jgi:hypothetical protein
LFFNCPRWREAALTQCDRRYDLPNNRGHYRSELSQKEPQAGVPAWGRLT